MSACTQGIAISEEPHCWARAPRWKEYFVDEDSTVPSIPVSIVQSAEEEILSAYGPLAVALATLGKPGFQAKAGETLLVPNSEGRLERVLVGPGGSNGAPEPWPWAALPTKLPAGIFHLQLPEDSPVGLAEQACLGWALGCYVFDRYKKAETQNEDGKPTTPRVAAKLVWPASVDRSSVSALADAFFWSRDLINTPAEDLGPGHMCAEAKAMAAMHQATVDIIQGDELLEAGYPAVHTVGRACSRPPALIDIRWTPQGAGDVASLPRLSLVGKGVCFDSGGLDIKTAAGMKTMKKDMGGAALVLALAHVIMNGGLPVQLRVLVPTVENSIAGNAYRPADVLRTRAGITVENGNTDAEGRLILCDALYEAATETPDLIVDAATLTGAARVALGPELLAVFTNCDDTWKQIDDAAKAQSEGVWRLPLYPQYRKLMDSKVADISSTGGEGAQGGAILAALYLLEFVKKAPRWVHIDTNAWVAPSMTGPGRPEGGEPMGLRALWQWMQTRYPKTT